MQEEELRNMYNYDLHCATIRGGIDEYIKVFADLKPTFWRSLLPNKDIKALLCKANFWKSSNLQVVGNRKL